MSNTPQYVAGRIRRGVVVVVAHEVDAVLPSSTLGSREGSRRLPAHEERPASQIADPPPPDTGTGAQVGLKDFKREGAAVLHPLFVRQGGQASDQSPYLQQLATGFSEVAPVHADVVLAGNGPAHEPRIIIGGVGYAFYVRVSCSWLAFGARTGINGVELAE